MPSIRSGLAKSLLIVAAFGVVAAPQTATAGGKKKKLNARVTGGGSVFTTGGQRVTHGFELRCNERDPRQNLEVNWDGNRFHLTDLTAAYCYDSGGGTAGQPSERNTPIDAYDGWGTGRYNGVDGARAEWIIRDYGEPGTRDRFKIVVYDAGGDRVLEADGFLNRGDHQFHFVKG